MWRRLLLDTLFAAVLAVVLALSAIVLSSPILASTCEIAGIAELTTTSASDFAAFAMGLAGSFALPPIVAWCAAMVGRYFEGAAPSGRRLAIYLGVASLALGAGLAGHVWRMKQTMSAGRASSIELAPTITLGSLGLASAGSSACLGAGLVMAVVVGWRARAATRP